MSSPECYSIIYYGLYFNKKGLRLSWKPFNFLSRERYPELDQELLNNHLNSFGITIHIHNNIVNTGCET
jgi:hypothetical protein